MMHENITVNFSSIPWNETESRKLGIPEFTKWVSSCILIGILTFNMLVIILMLQRRKQTRMGFFVTNLALADLCVGIFYVFPLLLFDWFGVFWNYFFCYIYYAYFSQVAYYVSTYAIVVIAIDRVYVIIKPLAAAAKGKKYRYGLAFSSWLLGLLLGIYYGYNSIYIDDESFCGHHFTAPLVAMYYDVSFILVVPLMIIVACYIAIIVKIHQRDRGGFVVVAPNKDKTYARQSNSKIITSSKVRTIQLLLVVVIAYVVCWTPFTTVACMYHYGYLKVDESQQDTDIFYALYVFAPFNSLANPLVFLLFNWKMFRGNTKPQNPYLRTVSRTETIDLSA